VRAGWLAPDPPALDRATLRQMVVRGLLVERDGIHFHPDAIVAAATLAGELLRADPAGFTLSQLRERLGVSRKYAIPLAGELDARRITLRRGDLRIAGPNLPTRPDPA
jgi:selenocysteine-specific elongation factor